MQVAAPSTCPRSRSLLCGSRNASPALVALACPCGRITLSAARLIAHVSGQWRGCASLRGLHGLTCLPMRIPPLTMGPRGNEVPSEGVTEFGGWPQPPRWVWAVTAVAAGALLAGVVIARTGPHHGAASSAAGRHSAHADGGGCAPAALGPGRVRTPAGMPVLVSPPAGAPVLVQLPAGGPVRVLPGGTGPRRAGSGALGFRPGPGLPDHWWLAKTWPPGPAPAASCCALAYCGAP
jgi:hypothetical protein